LGNADYLWLPRLRDREDLVAVGEAKSLGWISGPQMVPENSSLCLQAERRLRFVAYQGTSW
jgi:hypothetical protein